jgi:hypothetical protein
MRENIRYLSFSVWVISLNMMIFSSIHFPAACFHSLWVNNTPCVYIPHFLYPFIGWWGPKLIPYLAIMNSDAINMGVQLSLLYAVCIPLDICPEVVQQDHMVVIFLVFRRTSILISTVAARVYIPVNRVEGLLFFHILVNISCCLYSWWQPFWLGWDEISV